MGWGVIFHAVPSYIDAVNVIMAWGAAFCEQPEGVNLRRRAISRDELGDTGFT